MSTTDLFVELLIIGVGAAIGLFLLVLTVFGYGWLAWDGLLSLPALLPILAIVYVLGIVVDGFSDRLFEKIWHDNLFRHYYTDRQTYFNDRRTLYLHAKNLADLLEYGRSRLRICRGWTVNSVLILISLNLFIWTQVPNGALRLKASLFSTLALAGFAYGNWSTWRILTLNSYRKIRQQSDFVRQQRQQFPEEPNGEVD